MVKKAKNLNKPSAETSETPQETLLEALGSTISESMDDSLTQ